MEKEILIKEYTIQADQNLNIVAIKVYEDKGKRNLCILASPDILIGLGFEIPDMEMPVLLPQEVMENIIAALDGTLEKVVIFDLIDNRLHSRLHLLTAAGEEKQIEIRTPDALTLALRAEVPVYAYESVFEKDGKGRNKRINWYDLNEDFALEVLSNATPEDFAPCSVQELEAYLKKAVELEDYDLAARIKSIIESKA